MTATISNWGNSQGLRFPKDIMKELSLSIGDKLKVLVQDQKIILEPVKKDRVKYDINQLVSKLPKDYKAAEEFNDKVGLEHW